MFTLRHFFLMALLLVIGCDSTRGRTTPDGNSFESVTILDASGTIDIKADGRGGDVTARESSSEGADSDTSFDASALDTDRREGVGQADTPDGMTLSEPPIADEQAKPESPTKPDPATPTPDKPAVSNTARSGFRVLHWNIAGGKENNCQTAGITRAVMRFVRDFSQPVDFVNLNEICEAQFIAIRDELRKHWNKKNNDTFAIFQSVNPRKVGLALFSRENLRTITRLKIGNDQYGDRYVICGRQENRRVRLCGTHLTPADATARKQLALVMTKIEDFWKNQRDTVILAGDLNINPNDVALNAVYSSGANTPNNPNNNGAYRELDDNDAAHCKGYGERTHAGNGGPCGTGGKIDFIFARENRIVNGNYNADTLDIPQDCTGACSDHRALRGYVQLEYRTD